MISPPPLPRALAALESPWRMHIRVLEAPENRIDGKGPVRKRRQWRHSEKRARACTRGARNVRSDDRRPKKKCTSFDVSPSFPLTRSSNTNKQQANGEALQGVPGRPLPLRLRLLRHPLGGRRRRRVQGFPGAVSLRPTFFSLTHRHHHHHSLTTNTTTNNTNSKQTNKTNKQNKATGAPTFSAPSPTSPSAPRRTAC